MGLAFDSSTPAGIREPSSRPSGQPPRRTALALTGLFGSLLYVVGVLLPGSPPKPDVSTSQVLAFFLRERHPLLVGSSIELVSLIFTLMFLGELKSLISRSDDIDSLASVMTAAWVVLLTTVAVAMLPALAIIWGGVNSVDPNIVHWAFDIQNLGLYSVSAPAAVISVAVPSLAIWKNRLLPRWLAILGVVEVAVNILEVIGLSVEHGALAAGYVDGIGPVVWVLWVSLTSICMAYRSSRSTRLAAT